MEKKSTIQIQFQSQRIDQVYNIKRDKNQILGEGNFGMVIKGEDKVTKQIRAIKIIKKQKLMETNPDFSLLSNEYKIMANIDHPNLIRLYESYEDPKYFYFVLEYLSGKTLFDKLISETFQLNE